MYFDVNDLSQNTRRLNFPERKFTNKEPQITFRCQTENSGESRQFSEGKKKNPVQSILNITERKKAKGRLNLETKRGIKQKLKAHLDNIRLESRKNQSGVNFKPGP